MEAPTVDEAEDAKKVSWKEKCIELMEVGNWDEAGKELSSVTELFERVSSKTRNMMRDVFWHDFVTALRLLARTHEQSKEFDLASNVYGRALELCREHNSIPTLEAVLIFESFSFVSFQRGFQVEALNWIEMAIALDGKEGCGQQTLLWTRKGHLLMDLNRGSESVACMKTALDFAKATVPAGTIEYAILLKNVGETSWVAGEFNEAESFLRQAVSIWESGPDVQSDWRYGQCLYYLGMTRRQDTTESRKFLERSFLVMEKLENPRMWMVRLGFEQFCQASKKCQALGCTLDATKQCSACSKGCYCSKEHQEIDSKRHKIMCLKN